LIFVLVFPQLSYLSEINRLLENNVPVMLCLCIETGSSVAAYSTNVVLNPKKPAIIESAGTVGGKLWQKRPFNSGAQRPSRQAPKPSQLHYCEVCKISCAGAQVSS
jgi:hypothetical protein